jgi:hypothetical protein
MRGEPVLDRLMPIVYDELRRIAGRVAKAWLQRELTA